MSITMPSGNKLSARESEIIHHASKGETDREIADAMQITMATLRTYWSRIREKLGAVNRTHAIALTGPDRDDKAADPHGQLIEGLCRGRLAHWVCRLRSREVALDAHAEALFSLPSARGVDLDRLLMHIWTPDRMRFERFLSQSADLRPMTPIEIRAGIPGEYRCLVRTVNLVHQQARDSSLLLASTVVHTYA